MMNSFIIMILTMSFAGTIMASLLYLCQRALRNHIPKVVIYYLWFIVLLRFGIPFSGQINLIDYMYNRWGNSEELPITEMIQNEFTEVEGIATVEEKTETTTNNTNNIEVNSTNQSEVERAKSNIISINKIKLIILLWINVSFIILFKTILSYFQFQKFLKRTTRKQIFEVRKIKKWRNREKVLPIICNDYIQSPMICGMIHPRIYVPTYVVKEYGNLEKFNYILEHEMIHYKRKDIILKWMTILITSFHWFNPIIILVRKQIFKYCELSCDEKVTYHMTSKEKQSYGELLIQIASREEHKISTSAVSFCKEKEELKERLVNIMNTKKITARIVTLSIIVTVAFGCCYSVVGATSLNQNVSINGVKNSKKVVKTQKKDSKKKKNKKETTQKVKEGYLPSVHREGYKETELVFTLDQFSDGLDPDTTYCDPYKNRPSMTYREVAQYALQQIYDFTGFQMEKCYVLVSDGFFVFAVSPEDFDKQAFASFIAGSDYYSNTLDCLQISYKGYPISNSPIDINTVSRPENINQMTEEEIAIWYYEHSAFGDRREVVSTGEAYGGDFIKLVLDNGEFYLVELDDTTHVLTRIHGVYQADASVD